MNKEDSSEPTTIQKSRLEATTGFEPVNGSFADFCLTTWRRRRLDTSC